jgi:hypothetical protein
MTLTRVVFNAEPQDRPTVPQRSENLEHLVSYRPQNAVTTTVLEHLLIRVLHWTAVSELPTTATMKFYIE